MITCGRDSCHAEDHAIDPPEYPEAALEEDLHAAMAPRTWVGRVVAWFASWGSTAGAEATPPPRYQSLPHWLHLGLMAVFVSSLVHLSGPLFAPAEILSRAMVSSGTIWFLQYVLRKSPLPLPPKGKADREQSGDDLAILEIDRATFFHADQYDGRSPLNRCRLKVDIEAILSHFPGLITLGIDLDLSPMGDPIQDRCTFQILDLLAAKHAESQKREFRAVLIWPLVPYEKAAAQRWFDLVQSRGIRLADPRFELEFGMVRAYQDSNDRCPSFGVAVRVAQDDERFAACSAESPDQQPERPRRHQIAFERLALSPTAMHLNDESGYAATLDGQVKSLESSKVRRVLFGAGYTEDEIRQTPIGKLFGVEIHAAIATQDGPVENSACGFALDVMVGVLFGALVHRLWQRYLMQRLGLGARPAAAQTSEPVTVPAREMAWCWLALLALVSIVITVLLAFFSGVASYAWSVWITPIPILLGMACDALVTGSLQALIHAREHGVIDAPAVQQRALRGWRQLLAQGPMLIWLFVVGWNLKYLFHL